MSLKIYGIEKSRAMRTIWMCLELGVDYELVRVPPMEAAANAALGALNPARFVPTIDDDGVVLWESMAINLYLARKHGGPLAPADIAEEGHALKWSFFAATEVEPSATTVLFHGVLLPEERRQPSLVGPAMEKLHRPLSAIDEGLRDRAYLLGDRFTVADLNVASILAFLMFAKTDLSAYGRLDDWLRRCFDRPQAKAALALRG